jgi:nucleoside-diphosphate-sugar epimerase
MKKKILIVGGSGFIGTNILKKIDKNKHKVISTYFKNKNFFKVKKVNYLKGNLTKLDFCAKITKSVDIVVMCAAVSSGAMVMQNNPLFHVDDNVKMNLNILKASSLNKVKKFIFISSNTVYPVSRKPMKESDVNFTLFHKYFNVGWMKIFSEKLCEMYKDKMSIAIIRPGNIYGPHDKFDPVKSKVIPSLIRKFSKKKTIEVWGNGNDIKDFIYIEDFVNILLKIMNRPYNFIILNVATGKSINLKKIISILSKKFNFKKNKIKFNRTKPTMIPVRKISVVKLKKLINFKLQFPLEEGIKKTIKYYQSYKN